MLLFVGLGNPGAEYARNRHNIGFVVIEELARRYRFGAGRRRFEGTINEGTISDERIIALRPQTYMNESGRSVGAAMRFFKLSPPDVYVFHDEIDLAFGKVRVKCGGGSAGNNGIKSIMAHIGEDFWRIRIGVGHPGNARGHVLSDFSKAEREEMAKVVETLVANADLLATRDAERYMSKLALVTNPPRNAGPKRPAEDED